jgi:hypothetical protein
MEVMTMRLGIAIQSISKRSAGALILIAISGFGSANAIAQSIDSKSRNTSTSVSLATEHVTSAVVFETEATIVRRITVSPNSTGYHYRHPGGSIVLLSEYSYPIPLPLSEELKVELKVGDAIRVPSGDYVLENPTMKPLDFLSIEMKH